jgi:hypothetical protein
MQIVPITQLVDGHPVPVGDFGKEIAFPNPVGHVH